MINILSVVNDRSFGIWSKNIIKSLYYLNQPYSFFPLHPIQLAPHEGDFLPALKTGMSAAETFDINAPSLTIWHPFSLAQQAGARRCAWTLWELTRLNALEKHHLNSLDLLIVPSEWHRQIAQNEGIKSEIQVCPLGVDISKYYAISTLKSKDKTIFLSVGKWEKRKGHDTLPSFFASAFSSSDPVELWCSHNNPFLTQEEIEGWKKLYTDKIPPHQIRFIEEWLPETQLNELYNKADAGLCLSRSEGFGLPNLEMMACGLPIIGSNYSAHTTFMTPENTHLVNIDKLEKASDNKFFSNAVGEWAHFGKAQEEQIVSHMRKIHQEKQEQGTIFNTSGVETAQNLTWLNVTQQLIGIINP